MADSVSQTDASDALCSLAKSLAPEDVRVGDYVAPLHETYDYASFFWCCDDALEDRSQTVPIRFVASGSGEPLRVKAFCLPFVLVKHPVRGDFTLDIRRHQLARLDRAYGKLAWKSLKQRKDATKRKRSKKQSRK